MHTSLHTHTNTHKDLWNYYNWKKIMEKPISHLFSVHSLCPFDSSFSICILTFFSKLVSFLFFWGKQVYVYQALFTFISFNWSYFTLMASPQTHYSWEQEGRAIPIIFYIWSTRFVSYFTLSTLFYYFHSNYCNLVWIYPLCVSSKSETASVKQFLS